MEKLERNFSSKKKSIKNDGEKKGKTKRFLAGIF